MRHVRVRLLGGFEAGGAALPSGMRSHLLAYLACSEEWVPRERLAHLFWPDLDANASRRNLRQLLSRVRQLPGLPALELEKERMRWRVDSDVALIREAARREDWRGVTAMFAGDLLAGHEPDGSGSFDAWLELERDGLRTLHRRAVLAVAREQSEAHDHAAAADALESLTAREEPDEEAVRAFMEQAYLAGQRDRALRTFHSFQALLDREYGLEPLEATTALAATIRAASPLDLTAVSGPDRPITVPLGVLRPPRMVDRTSLAARVIASGAPLILIAGEAGTGKTRFLQELGQGAPWITCLESSRAVPYRAVTELINRLLPVHGVPSSLGDYAGDLARLVPEAMPGHTPAAAEPETAGPRLREALVRYLTATLGTSTQRFLLIADDLQWADPASLQLLGELAARSEVQVLGAFRQHEMTEALQELQSQPEVETCSLETFDPDTLGTLLGELTGKDDVPAVFTDWLHTASSGNARFALELLQHLFQTGVLDESVPGWHHDLAQVPDLIAPGHIPPSAGQLISRRTARLDPASRRVLHGAAVLADPSDPQLLAALAGCSEDEALSALEQIEHVGLTIDGAFPHDLVREAVYRSIHPARRRSLHGRAGLVLAERSRHLLAAEHLFTAQQQAPAISQMLAGVHELRMKGLYEQALAIISDTLGVQADGLPAESRLELLNERAALLRGLARNAEAFELALEVTRDSHVPLSLTTAYSNLSSLAISAGSSEEAERFALEALRQARLAGDRWHEQNALSSLGIALHFRGRTGEALEVFRQLLAELRESGSEIDVAAQLSSIGALLDQLSRSGEALELHEEALEIAVRQGATRQQVDFILNLLYCREELGLLDEAFLNQVAAVLDIGRFESTDQLRYAYALALGNTGRTEEARRHWLQVTREADNPTVLLMAWNKLASKRVSGESDAMVATALERMRELAEQTDFPEILASAALTLLRAGDEETGRKLLQRSGYDGASLPAHLSALNEYMGG